MFGESKGLTDEEKERLWEMVKAKESQQVGGTHYQVKGIQPITYIHANNLNFDEGNVVKYITRHREKNGVDDVKKCVHYALLELVADYGLDMESVNKLMYELNQVI